MFPTLEPRDAFCIILYTFSPPMTVPTNMNCFIYNIGILILFSFNMVLADISEDHIEAIEEMTIDKVETIEGFMKTREFKVLFKIYVWDKFYQRCVWV